MQFIDSSHIIIFLTQKELLCISFAKNFKNYRVAVKNYTSYPMVPGAIIDNTITNLAEICNGIVAFLNQQRLWHAYVDWILDDSLCIIQKNIVFDTNELSLGPDKTYAISSYLLYTHPDGGSLVIQEKIRQATLLQLQLICHITNTFCGYTLSS